MSQMSISNTSKSVCPEEQTRAWGRLGARWGRGGRRSWSWAEAGQNLQWGSHRMEVWVQEKENGYWVEQCLPKFMSTWNFRV